jgi:hypothetical protein
MITSDEYQQLQDRIARNAAEAYLRSLSFDPKALIEKLNIQPAPPPTKDQGGSEAHAKLAIEAGLKPRKQRSPEEQRAYQTACMKRLRAEQRGLPINQFPKRMRKQYERKTKR